MSRGSGGGDDRNDKDRTDADCNDADGNDVNPNDGNGRPPRSTLCASFDRIREFVLSHALLFRNNGGEVDGGGATQDAGFFRIACASEPESRGCIKKEEEGARGGKTAAAMTAMAIGGRSLLWR